MDPADTRAAERRSVCPRSFHAAGRRQRRPLRRAGVVGVSVIEPSPADADGLPLHSAPDCRSRIRSVPRQHSALGRRGQPQSQPGDRLDVRRVTATTARGGNSFAPGQGRAGGTRRRPHQGIGRCEPVAAQRNFGACGDRGIAPRERTGTRRQPAGTPGFGRPPAYGSGGGTPAHLSGPSRRHQPTLGHAGGPSRIIGRQSSPRRGAVRQGAAFDPGPVDRTVGRRPAPGLPISSVHSRRLGPHRGLATPGR